jgi:hypothetical protein
VQYALPTQMFQKLVVPASGDRTNYGILLCWDFGNKICEIWGFHMEAMLVKIFFWHDNMSQTSGLRHLEGWKCLHLQGVTAVFWNTGNYSHTTHHIAEDLNLRNKNWLMKLRNEPCFQGLRLTLSKGAWEVRLLTAYCHVMKGTEPVCVETLQR